MTVAVAPEHRLVRHSAGMDVSKLRAVPGVVGLIASSREGRGKCPRLRAPYSARELVGPAG